MLIIDSGSTKADWMYISGENKISFESTGINPTLLDINSIQGIIKNEVISKLKADDVRRIFFFGAGCSDQSHSSHIQNAFADIFPNATVSAQSDIVGAVYATCGNSPGYCGILGTGSNLIYFDGKNIKPNNFGLGYILADEGAGTYLGKKLITAYLYKALPAGLQNAFDKKYSISREVVLQNVYGNSKANAWLASFVLFYAEHSQDPWAIKTIKDGFNEFITLYILNDDVNAGVPIHFIGSVAFAFQNILKEELIRHKLLPGKIIKKPITAIAEYLLY
jgi:glucosamine kinase